MPRLSPRSPKRKQAQQKARYRKRLKTTKVFDGCNRDNHDVIMFDKSEIDVIDDQSKTWPGYVEPKISGLQRFGYKSTLAKSTKLQFNGEENVTKKMYMTFLEMKLPEVVMTYSIMKLQKVKAVMKQKKNQTVTQIMTQLWKMKKGELKGYVRVYQEVYHSKNHWIT